MVRIRFGWQWLLASHSWCASYARPRWRLDQCWHSHYSGFWQCIWSRQLWWLGLWNRWADKALLAVTWPVWQSKGLRSYSWLRPALWCWPLIWPSHWPRRQRTPHKKQCRCWQSSWTVWNFVLVQSISDPLSIRTWQSDTTRSERSWSIWIWFVRTDISCLLITID